MPRRPAAELLISHLPLPSEDEHAVWLLERQDEDRRRGLIRRLEQLADDAKIERLDAAAALLRATAEELRFALARDRATKVRTGR